MRPSHRLRAASIACFLGVSSIGSPKPLVAQPVATWRLTEDLRIGADTGPASFTDIRGIAVSKNGNIFVLDFKSQEIRVFDPAGKFLRLAARRGAGPGEIANANGIVAGPDGRVWVNDPSNARFSIYDADGHFDRQMIEPSWGYSFVWSGVIDQSGRMVEPYALRLANGGATEMHLRRITSDARHVDTLSYPPCSRTTPSPPPFTGSGGERGARTFLAVPFQPRMLSVLDAEGIYWCSAEGDYSIYVMKLGRTDTLAIARSNLPRLPVTDAERAAEIRRVDSVLAKYPKREADYSAIPKFKPALIGMFAGARGEIWVQRPPTGPTTSELDVWNASGKQIATVHFDGRLQSFITPRVVGDYLYAVVTDEDDVQNVVRHRIARR